MTLDFDVKHVLRRMAPVTWATLMFVVLSLNFWAGWKVDGFLIGCAFVCVAIFGAFAAAYVREAPVAMKPVLAAVICFQIALGQWAGWQAIGLNLAESTAQLDTEADTHNTNRDELKRAQERRTALGTPRPVAAIAAERELECKRTSRTYKDGKGPRCTALMSEEAAAEEAAALDKRIPDLKQQLADGAQITDANAPFSVAMKLSSAVASFIARKPVELTREDVLFGFKIFFVFLLEFLATCGPMLLQMLEREAPVPVTGPRKQITYQRMPRAPDEDEDAVADKASSGYLTSGLGGERPAQAETEPGRSNSPAPNFQHRADAKWASEAPNNSVHGAPINLNVYTSPAGPSDAHPHPGREAQQKSLPPPAVASDQDGQADANVRRLRAVTQDAFAPQAPDAPIDRSNVNQVLDGLLAFKAACLTDQGGACVAAALVFEAYQAWAGPRAIAEGAFHSLFEAAASVPHKMIGGVPHYTGVRLRAERATA